MTQVPAPQQLTISTGTIIRTVFVLVVTFTLYLLLDLVMIVLTSVVIASAVEPATRWFAKYRVPRVLAVLMVYLLAFGFIFGFVYIFIPPLFVDITQLSLALPASALDVPILDRLAPLSSLTGGFFPSLSIDGMLADIQSMLASFSSGTFTTASNVFGGAFSFILILVISFYLAVQDRGIENFLRIIVPLRYESYVVDLWKRSQYKIGQWMKGQLLLGLIVGVLVYLGLTILGVKYALVLAILAAMFELIPIFGPVLSAIPAVFLGLAESASLGLMVIGLYVIIQQFENHLIYPLVVKKIVGVPAIIVILALIVGGQLAGFLGIILAVPLATIIMELAHDAERRKLNVQSGPSAGVAK
ncbi:MAG: AI-2E family transporter [Patescibacteria group bacterium]